MYIYITKKVAYIFTYQQETECKIPKACTETVDLQLHDTRNGNCSHGRTNYVADFIKKSIKDLEAV